MKTWFGVALVAGMLLCTGCTTSTDEGAAYSEIRVDAFSNYWATQKSRLVSLPGRRLVWSNVDSLGSGDADTLILASASDDKTAQLPAHITIGPELDLLTRLVYTVDRDPQDFSCYFDNGGHEFFQSDTAPPQFTMREVFTSFFEGNEALEARSEYWFTPRETQAVLSPIGCVYLKGKGFYFDYSIFGDYGANPRVPGSTLIIRYR